eukprot:scaffold115628_cov37-Tisochrysis_lutea.AAC.2
MHHKRIRSSISRNIGWAFSWLPRVSVLQDGFGCKVREHPQVILQATVVYENGEEISLRHNESQFDESFLNECLLVSGAAQFSLRFGQQVLTDKHRRRLFCIRITAKDPQYQCERLACTWGSISGSWQERKGIR